MNLFRLLQPHNPVFWLMLVLNALSLLLAWVVRNRPLSGWGMTVIAIFATGNAVVGVWLAWRLMRQPDPHPSDSAGPPGSKKAR